MKKFVSREIPVNTITGHMLFVQFTWVSQEPWSLTARFWYQDESPDNATFWVFAPDMISTALATPGERVGLGDVKFELDVDFTMWLRDNDQNRDIPYVIEFENVHDHLYPFLEEVVAWGENNAHVIAEETTRQIDAHIQNLLTN